MGPQGTASGGGFDWGSLIGSFFGGGKASGGLVSPGMFYEVNERGPEMLSVGGRDYLMMGKGLGNITPNHQLGGGLGGGFHQEIHNHYRAPYDARTEEQKAAKVAYLTNQALRRNS